MAAASALDVASYVLQRRSGLTAMELQKLVYYAQAWNLAWDGRPIFDEEIQAWPHGPVVPRLYQKHKKRVPVASIDGGDARRLSDAERRTVDAVLAYYGGRDAAALRRISHAEKPWQDARGDLPEGAPSRAVIPQQALRSFYTIEQILDRPGPTRPTGDVREATLEEALAEAGRQMTKWRRTLDWLAVR
jgi:uncharacterized phage-associated protein